MFYTWHRAQRRKEFARSASKPHHHLPRFLLNYSGNRRTAPSDSNLQWPCPSHDLVQFINKILLEPQKVLGLLALNDQSIRISLAFSSVHLWLASAKSCLTMEDRVSPLSQYRGPGQYWLLRRHKYTTYNAKIASNPVGLMQLFLVDYGY